MPYRKLCLNTYGRASKVSLINPVGWIFLIKTLTHKESRAVGEILLLWPLNSTWAENFWTLQIFKYFIRGVENLLRNEHPQRLTVHYSNISKIVCWMTSSTPHYLIYVRFKTSFNCYRGVTCTVSLVFKVT